MSDCNHNCEGCSKECANRTASLKVDGCGNIKKVIAVVSGKGGVGKSMVTSLLAVKSSKMNFTTAVLDADITGPSVPKAFNVSGKAEAINNKLLPMCTENGIKLMSINFLLDEETTPVIWRAPIITGTVKQFWTDVLWDDVDVMFVDCPPGTGDVPLTVFQSLPVDGIIVVTSPQDLVSMIVEKAVNMAEMMNVPIIGIVENMSYFICDNCGEKHYIYGKSNIEELAEKHNINNIARIPMDKRLRELVDEGRIEAYQGNELDMILEAIKNL